MAPAKFVTPTITVATLLILSCGSGMDPVRQPQDRIAPGLLEPDSANVLILGTEQLLEFPDGFRRATERFASRDRRSLREETIDRLREIATEEQAPWMGTLNGRGQSFWIINAVAARVSRGDVAALAQLPNVRYIFDAGALPPGPLNDRVSLVLPQPGGRTFSLQGKRVPWNVRLTGTERVWSDLGVTGEGIVVAMFDVGVDYGHEELRSAMWTNRGETPNNGIDDDGNGYVDDLYGFDFGRMSADVRAPPEAGQHGTFTSGIVAGNGSGGIQTGLAPMARLMVLRASGLVASIRAYQYAVDNGADVINMSFSLPNLGDLRAVWRLMAEQATIAGLVSVSGAGNFQQSAPIPLQQRIPEGIPAVISAGGVDSLLNLVPFSSLGPVDWSGVMFYHDHPDLIKPDVVGFPGAGYPIISPTGRGYVDPNNSLRGNSFSGPHAAGVAALMLSANPGLPAWEVKTIMEETARDIAPVGKDNQTGSGLIDAFAAVQAALDRD